MISWKPPNANNIKCNIDGASKGNSGKSSYVYCLRDQKGYLIYAQAEEISETTNVEAEAVAIKEGIHHCVGRGYSRVTIETNSLLLKNILQGKWKIPWYIRVIVEDTLALMKDATINIEHIYREGNSLAYYLTNHAFEVEGRQQYNTFRESGSTKFENHEQDNQIQVHFKMTSTKDQLQKGHNT
ncbi:hypothetical protein KY285_023916 [Solanum tuberosum]|nr:hypothetical protein KY289_024256 [Solanum tuberosum]KAH0676115.1 hypothetical protein KY285_023916 [Solanum tuberosum]